MDAYTNLLTPFASFFQLAVAFNLSYAASEQLRQVIKKGFLYSVRNLASLYEDKKNELDAKLEVLSDEDLNSADTREIKNKLTDKLNALRDEDKSLDLKIKESQEITALKIQPIYIYTALIALFFLFIGGLESINGIFPRNEIFTILLLSTVYTLIFYFLAIFSPRPITAALSSTLALIFCTFSTIYPIEIPNNFSFSPPGHLFGINITTSPYTFSIPIDFLSNRNLLFYSLALSFFPFILASVVLVFISFFLEMRFRLTFLYHMIEIKYLKFNLDRLSNSKNILKSFAKSK